MKIIKWIVIFLGTLVLYLMIFSSFFSADENNVLQAPDWFMWVGFAVSIFSANVSVKRKPVKREENRKSHISGKIKRVLQEIISSAKAKKEYNNLSEAEKWKLERESSVHTESAIQRPQKEEFNVEPLVVDYLTDAAAKVIYETGQASVSMLQRRLHVGYAQAAMIMDRLEEIGVVGPFQGSTPRDILISQNAYCKNVKIADPVSENASKNFASGIDINQIIEDENKWRMEQQGLSEADYELSKIDLMEGHEFEHWCADLLKKNSFSNVKLTPISGDQGVDILAEKDGIRYAVQCKCYSSDLGNTPIQEVNTGKTVYHCQIGVVMTNRYFTKGAKDAADATGVLLWDRNKLKQMMGS